MKLKKMSPDLSIRYREFPDMRFGEADGRIYFDATHYAKKKEVVNLSVLTEFEHHFMWWVKNLSDAYSIPVEDIMVTDTDTGHLFFEESLDLLFIAYIEPAFSIYVLDRISEMLINGVTLSDTALVMSIKDRFGREDILKFYEKDEEEQV